MRTEDDLRAALTALERHAPAAARVLSGIERRSSHGLRSPRTTRWAAGIATAAALAGVVTALTLPGGASGTSQKGGVASDVPITKATLQAKITAAFSSAGDQIAVRHETDTINNGDPSTHETWSYPLQPRVGQQVRIKSIDIAQRGAANMGEGEIYLMPATQVGLAPVKAQTTTVSYTGKVWWYEDSAQPVTQPIGPEFLANLPPLGKWTAQSTTLNGRPAIKFTLHHTPTKFGGSMADELWVDATTYLPLRETSDVDSPGMDTIDTSDYEYLPATPANLAKLTPTIPAGFKRVYPAPPKVHQTPPNQVSPSPVPLP
jgi:hypothetical protein